MTKTGDRIKERMDALGMTQDQLAKAVGISQPAIVKILDNRTKQPKSILQIAEALQTSPSYLTMGKHPAALLINSPLPAR